ncbi:RluA family pseudouridine synthase [Shimia thalassica]|uniref:RluA family pseudouridine synthase n=1 Tax=Shimia thalassica TaxID=1715693 RepID=UPI001C09BBDC|nr:RluA family pseudouridine synthase [Shimia thalassica]MBU2942121.1 RluA family pseudouridine synthase [Shimia thalassica]MDO6502910.1 RluA family pseudouridine synthase [Shimia thalassica]
MATTLVSFQINADPPARLDKALSRDVPEEATLSRTRLAKLMADGCITVNGTVAGNPKAKVAEGAMIEITVPVADESHIGPEDIPLDVVYEDDDLIVINKPAGMVVHPAPGTPNGTLVNALLHHCGDSLSGVGGVQRPGIVHRIDKETSGLLVVAKSDKAHQGLAAQFEKHTVERYYQAVVYGVPDANDPRLRGVKGVNFESGNIMRITTHLARHKTDRQKQAVLFQGGRHAVTRSRIVEAFGTPAVASLIECWLETGRTHQIRVHMAHAGHGLVGDPVYGGRRKLAEKAVGAAAIEAAKTFPRQALHAAVLGFVHPVTGGNVRFEAELPEDMQSLIAAFQGGTPAS